MIGLEPGRYFVARGVFKLPDNWKGTLSDALRAMADHYESTPNRHDGSTFDFPADWLETTEDFAHMARYQAHTSGKGKNLSSMGCHEWTGTDWRGRIHNDCDVDKKDSDE